MAEWVRSCDLCGTSYVAKRATSRFCSTTCRQRHHRGQPAEGGPAPQQPQPPAEQGTAGVVTVAVTEELEAANVMSSALAAAALTLARLIDRGDALPAGVAALVKEFRATRAEALAEGQEPPDSVTEARDELAERRAAAVATSGVGGA